MKTATVTAYINTGFSGINIPDSPNILEYCQKKQLDVINCLPLSGQVNVSIRVKAYDELHETDYIKMVFSGDGTSYYGKVNGYVYLSSDTVEISMTMDYWLTLGGINNVSSISGITSRIHIPKADDTLFAYTEPDIMINPAKPLKMVSEDFSVENTVKNSPPNDDVVVLLSTLDLYAIGKAYEHNTDDDGKLVGDNAIVLGTTIKEVDPDTSEEKDVNYKVTIPKLFAIKDVNYSDHIIDWDLDASDVVWVHDHPYGILKGWIPKENQELTNGEQVDLTVAEVGYFDATDPTVKKGISILHNCGVESALLDQYKIPKEYIDKSESVGSISRMGRVNIHVAHNNNGMFDTSSALYYEYGNYSPRNKKVYVGNINAYTIYARANADMQSFNPEVLAQGMGGNGPIFRLCLDIRRNGGAMCSPVSLNGDHKNWFMNFVKEMEFQSVPLKFNGASGSLISGQLQYLRENTMKANFTQAYPLDGGAISEREGLFSQMFKSAGTTLGGFASFIGGAIATIGSEGAASPIGIPMMIGGATALFGGGADVAYTGTRKLDDYDINRTNRKAAYAQQVFEEQAGLRIRNMAVAPQLKFQQSQTLRELIGNGFMIIKYQMTDDDLRRCDKLLTMYGYSLTKDLTKSDLTNRPAFNYVEAGEVHITTSVPVPKWVREGAEDQLVGARIWHKQFDVSEYEDNE